MKINHLRVVATFLGLLGLLFVASTACCATIYPLVNGQGLVQIDATQTTGAGQLNWIVSGTNQLSDQWFYVNIDGGPVQAVNLLSAPTLVSSSANTVDFYYQNSAGVRVTLDFNLAPGSSGSDDLSVQAAVTNNGSSAHSVNLFEYADFDLNNSAAGDTGYFPTASPFIIGQTKGATTVSESNSIDPFNDYVISDPTTVLNEISTGSLSNSPSFPSGSYTGDVAWGVEWTFGSVAANGGQYQVSKDEDITGGGVGLDAPEPNRIVLWGLMGIATCALLKKRRLRVQAII